MFLFDVILYELAKALGVKVRVDGRDAFAIGEERLENVFSLLFSIVNLENVNDTEVVDLVADLSTHNTR